MSPEVDNLLATGPVVTYLAVTLTSLLIGFWAGSISGGKKFSATRGSGLRPPNLPEDEDEGTHLSPTGSNVIEELRGEEIDETKLVLVVREDLGMTSGKIAAQCSHATLACYLTLHASNRSLLRQWEGTGQTKVALRCANENELHGLQARALELKLCTRSIRDAGRTQIAAGSTTVLGIGPGPTKLINKVTGKLRLL